MKLKHYFNRLQAQIREVDSELEELSYKSIVNKILTALSVQHPEFPLPNYLSDMKKITETYKGNSTLRKLPYIMQNMGILQPDYIKYYFLDLLTNQNYIDLLINHIVYMYNHNINFIYNFSLDNFTSCPGNPELYIEFMQVNQGYTITSITYSNPFNGEMELEDFLSILTDSIYLLNPEQCLYYLIQKLLSGVSVIPYSRGKEITLMPIYLGNSNNYTNSIASQFRVVPLEGNLAYFQPIIKPTTPSLAKLVLPIGEFEINLAYLKTLFN